MPSRIGPRFTECWLAFLRWGRGEFGAASFSGLEAAVNWWIFSTLAAFADAYEPMRLAVMPALPALPALKSSRLRRARRGLVH